MGMTRRAWWALGRTKFTAAAARGKAGLLTSDPRFPFRKARRATRRTMRRSDRMWRKFGHKLTGRS